MTATIMSIRSRLAKRLLRTHLLDWWQGQPHRVFPLRCHLRLAAKASSRESFLYMVPANTSWSQGPQSPTLTLSVKSEVDSTKNSLRSAESSLKLMKPESIQKVFMTALGMNDPRFDSYHERRY